MGSRGRAYADAAGGRALARAWLIEVSGGVTDVMGSQRLWAAVLFLERRARVARQAEGQGDAPRGMAVGAQVLDEAAELGQRQRPVPAAVPDVLQHRVVVGET